MTKKLNKLKEIVSSKKKKAIEATAGKFVSNGSLLSQNGVHNATSENELQNKGGEHSLHLVELLRQSVMAVESSRDEPSSKPYLHFAHHLRGRSFKGHLASLFELN